MDNVGDRGLRLDCSSVSIFVIVVQLLDCLCAFVSSETGARSHASLWGPLVNVSSDRVELALLSWLMVLRYEEFSLP